MKKRLIGFSILAVGVLTAAVAMEPVTLHGDFVREIREWPAGRGAVGQTVFVKRPTAELRRGASPADPIVANLTQGDALTVLEVSPARLRVRTTTGVEGFISRINVDDKRPAGVSGGQLIVSSNTAARQGANAGSIRGLSPMAEKYASDMKLSEDAVEQVKKMERIGDEVTTEQLQAFVQEGGIVAP